MVNIDTSGMEDRALHVLGQALAFAIAIIDGLPERKRPASDRDDMVALLLANFDRPTRELHARLVEIATGQAPDMTDWKSAS